MPVNEAILRELDGNPQNVPRETSTTVDNEILGAFDVDNNQSPAPEKSRALSMRSAVLGYPEEDSRSGLSFANDIFQKYVGGVKASKEVVVPGTEGKATSYKVSDKGVETAEVEVPVSDNDIQRARDNVRAEVSSARDFLLQDMMANEEKLAPYLMRPRDQVNQQGEAAALPGSMGELLEQAVPNMAPQTIGQGQRQGMFSPDKVANRIADLTGDPKAMTDYMAARMHVLDNEHQKRLMDLEARYPVRVERASDGLGRANISIRDNEAAYNQEKAAIDNEYVGTKRKLVNSGFALASVKAVNRRLAQGKQVGELDPLEIGMEVAGMLGEGDKVNREIRLIGKGLGINPNEKVGHETGGYRAMQYAAMEAFANGRDEVAKELGKKTEDYQQKVRDNNPEFVKQQLVRALSDEIYKSENPFLSSIRDNDPTMDDIYKAADRIGIDRNELGGITPEDIQNPKNILSQGLSSFIRNTAGGLYQLGARNFFKHIVGADADAVDHVYDDNWYDNTWFGRNLEGKKPDAARLFGTGSLVNTDKTSPEYLMDKANADAGKFNWDARAILGQVADGAGQIAAMGYGGAELGALVKGSQLGKVGAVANNADKIGLALNTFLTQYDGNYREALATVGDNPEDEWKRNAFASLKTLSSAATEMILPDTKIVRNILSPGTAAGKSFMDLLNKKGISALTESAVKNVVKEGIKGGFKDWGKEITEDVLDETAGKITQAFLAPKSLENADLGQELKETVITSAISSMIPTVGGGINRARVQSRFNKELMYQVGNDPQTYIDEIKAQMDSGQLDPKEAEAKIAMVNKLSDIVKNKVPQSSVINEQDLTRTQQVDYANNLMQEMIAEEHKAGVSDGVQEQVLDGMIKNLQAEREEILKNAGAQAQSNVDEGSINFSEVMDADRPVLYNGQRASLYRDGQTLIAKIEGTNREYEIGNVDELKNTPISEFGIAQEKNVVDMDEDGNVIVRGRPYLNMYSDPKAAINYDEDGNVLSVNLNSHNGQARTFRGDVAEDIAYLLTLKEFENNEQSRQQLEAFINESPEVRAQIEDARSELAPESGTDTDNAEVQRVPAKRRKKRGVTQQAGTPAPAPAITPPADQQAAPSENLFEFEEEPDFAGESKLFVEEQPAASAAEEVIQPATEAIQEQPAPEVNFFETERSPEEVTQSENVSAEIRDRFTNARKLVGRTFTRTLPNGSKLPGRYVLTSSDAVTPSHNPDTFSTSAGYPLLEGDRNPNDRDYSLKSNTLAVMDRATKYDGQAVTNVPTVDKNGVVIDGNDRTMSGQIAARNNTDGAYIESLRDNAEMYGFTAAQVDEFLNEGLKPRLIFVPDQIQPYTTDTFAQFNRQSTKTKTALETAVEFSRTLPDDLIDKMGNILDEHDEMSEFYSDRSAQKSMYDLLKNAGLIDTNNSSAFFDVNTGNFTGNGKELIKNVMLGKVLTEESLKTIQAYPSLMDKIVRGIKNTVAIDAIGDYGFGETLNNAVELYHNVTQYMKAASITSSAKEAGLEQYMRQVDMFDMRGDESAAAIQLYTLFADKAKNKFKSFTGEMLERTRQFGANPGADLFGNTAPDKYELLNQTRQALINYEQAIENAIAKQSDAEQPGSTDIEESELDVQETGEGSQVEAIAEPETATESVEEGAENSSTENFVVDHVRSNFSTDKLFYDFTFKEPYDIQREATGKPVEVWVEKEFNRVHVPEGIAPALKNRGYGKEIYKDLIEKFGSISTVSFESSSTQEAQRVWKSLIESGDYYSGRVGPYLMVAKDAETVNAFLDDRLKLFPGENPEVMRTYPSSSSFAVEAQEPAINNPVSEDSPLTAAIAEFNKYKNFVNIKERKLELLEEAGKRNTDEWQKEYTAWKSYKEKVRKAQDEVNIQMKADAKTKAAKVRSFKIKGDGNVYSGTPAAVVAVLGKNLYNATLEVVALSLETTASLQTAINEGVRYVNDRWFTRWPEQEFRDMVAETGNLPLEYELTPEDIRAKKIDPVKLTAKNRAAADALIETVRNNTNSLRTVLDTINEARNISPATKQRLTDYIKSTIGNEVYKVNGEAWAQDILQRTNDNFDEALETLERELETELLASETLSQRENARNKFAAAKTYIETQKTLAGIADESIKPVYSIEGEAPSTMQAERVFVLPKEKLTDKIQVRTQDKYARLARAQENSLEPIDKRTDALLAMRLKRSKAWAQINQVRDYLGSTEYRKGSFFDRLKNAGIDIEQFGLYLYAKHARERNEYNARLRQQIFEAKVMDLNRQIADAMNASQPTSARAQDNLNQMGEEVEYPADVAKLQAQLREILEQKVPAFVLMPDGGSGMTNAQADEILQAAEEDGTAAKFAEFENEFRENVVIPILDHKFESGIINEEEYNKLKDFYKNYVPLKIDMEEEEGESDGEYFKKSGRNGKDLYKSKGAVHRSYTERQNPVLQAMKDLEYSITKGEDNKAAVALANLARANPNPAVWEVKKAKYEILRDKEGKVIYNKEVDQPQTAMPFYENGKKGYVILHDPGLQQIQRRIGNPTFNKWIQYPSRLFTSVNTLINPNFLIANPIVDQQDAYMSLLAQDNKEVVKNFRKYVKSAPKLVYQIWKGDNAVSSEWKQWIDDWKKNGGEITFLRDISREEEAKQTLKLFDSYGKTISRSQAKHLLFGFKRFATGLEQMTRVMAYRAAVEAGIDPEKSALISRNATVDFERKGVYGTYINSFQAFANAGTQGLTNLLFLATKSNKVKKFLGAMVLSGMAEVLVNNALSDCSDPTGEDCYWEKPEFEKRKNFQIKNPFGKGFFNLRVGRAFGWFNYMGKLIASMGLGKMDVGTAFTNLFNSVFEYYNPVGGDAPLVQRIAGNASFIPQLYTNRNSLDLQITPDNNKGLPEHMNFFPSTKEEYVNAAKYLSELTGGSDVKGGKVEVSPEHIEWAMQTFGGGLWGFMMQGYQTTKNKLAGQELKAKEAPFVNVFYRESEMAGTKEQYYKLADKSEKEVFTKEEHDKLAELLDRLVEGGQITPDQRGRRFNWINRNQTQIRKRIAAHEQKNEDPDVVEEEVIVDDEPATDDTVTDDE